MMEEMTLDLIKFMIIWAIVVVTFACVATLIFGSLEKFQELFPVIILYFEAALGNWNNAVYY